MKKFLSSLLFIFATMLAMPVHADEVCQNLWDNTQTVSSQYINGSIWQKYNVSLPLGDGTWTTRHISNVQPGTYSYSSDTGSIYSIVAYDGMNAKRFTVSPTGGTFTLTTPSEVWVFWPRPTDAASSTDIVIKPSICGTCDGVVKTYESAVGTISVPAGTISAANPIYPTFYNQGDMVLRAVNNLEGGTVAVADSYDVSTGKITRRVGMKVFDGTENWESYVWGGTDITGFKILEPNLPTAGYNPGYCSHYIVPVNSGGINAPGAVRLMGGSGSSGRAIMILWRPEYPFATVQEFKTFLAQQYAAGTPVTVYYALETPVEETVGTTYCADTIKIATTAYNSARFNSVQTDLNSAVATIRDIVTNTINQTAAIASLQADKQTRPEEQCPAGKKCLLVETEENGVIVPHWFPIIEAPEE